MAQRPEPKERPHDGRGQIEACLSSPEDRKSHVERVSNRDNNTLSRLSRGENGRCRLTTPSYNPSAAVCPSRSPPNRGSPFRIVSER